MPHQIQSSIRWSKEIYVDFLVVQEGMCLGSASCWTSKRKARREWQSCREVWKSQPPFSTLSSNKVAKAIAQICHACIAVYTVSAADQSSQEQHFGVVRKLCGIRRYFLVVFHATAVWRELKSVNCVQRYCLRVRVFVTYNNNNI